MEWFVRIISSPPWFSEEALAIHAISAIILLALALAAFRFRRMSSNQRKHMLLVQAMTMLSAGLIVRVAIDIVTAMNLSITTQPGMAYLNLQNPAETTLFFGVLLHRALMLAGFALLFLLHRPQPTKVVVLGGFLLAMTVYASIGEYYIFHLTALVLIGMICHNIIQTYHESRHPITLLTLMSFGLIALGQFLLMFKTEETFYLSGWLVQILGYAGLLATLYIMKINGNLPLKARNHR